MRCPPFVVVLGRRNIRHKVEALNPALRKLGTQEGLGSQWCNRLPSILQDVGGERGCGRGYVFCAAYLTDPPLKSSTYLRTRVFPGKGNDMVVMTTRARVVVVVSALA